MSKNVRHQKNKNLHTQTSPTIYSHFYHLFTQCNTDNAFAMLNTRPALPYWADLIRHHTFCIFKPTAYLGGYLPFNSYLTTDKRTNNTQHLFTV